MYKTIKTIIMMLVCLGTFHGLSVADVIIFDDQIVKGDIQYATVTTNMAYEGTSSVFYTTDSTSLSVFKFNLAGSVEISTNHVLNMRMNFDTTAGGSAKLRRMQIITSSSTIYTYEAADGLFLVDGASAPVSSGRVIFDDDINTWQLLSLDLNQSPGPLDVSKLRQVNLVFNDPVDVYVDDVTVAAIPEPATLGLFAIGVGVAMLLRKAN